MFKKFSTANQYSKMVLQISNFRKNDRRKGQRAALIYPWNSCEGFRTRIKGFVIYCHLMSLVVILELGCPTANFSEAVVDKLPKDLPNGIYFGLAQGWQVFFTHLLLDFS